MGIAEIDRVSVPVAFALDIQIGRLVINAVPVDVLGEGGLGKCGFEFCGVGRGLARFHVLLDVFL